MGDSWEAVNCENWRLTWDEPLITFLKNSRMKRWVSECPWSLDWPVTGWSLLPPSQEALHYMNFPMWSGHTSRYIALSSHPWLRMKLIEQSMKFRSVALPCSVLLHRHSYWKEMRHQEEIERWARGGQWRVENWEVKGVSEMDTHFPEAQKPW